VQINWNQNGEEGGAGDFGGQGNFVLMPVQTARRIVKALALVIDYLMVYKWVHLLETKHTLYFWNNVSDEFRVVAE
jgi:hypothetical protein